MKKIHLDLEALDVQTFEVAPPSGERGTVQAHQAATLPLEYCFFSVFDTCQIYC